MSYSKQVVLVTGGSRGIGAAIAIAYAKQVADVVIVGRNEEKLNNVAVECAKIGKKSLIIKADVTNDNEAKNIINQTIDTYGKLDVLVNNAGIIRRNEILNDNFMEIFDSVINTNMRAAVLMTNLAAPYLIKTKGNIINISSVAATKIAPPYFASYRVSKAALTHFTRCMALEFASTGVRVNSVSPGPVDTDIFNTAGIPHALDLIMAATAFNKMSKPAEIANIVLFLASGEAKSITGSDFVTDNAMLVK